MMNFVAIDFETATSERNSACSVAVVEIQNGRMTNSYNTLIKPPQKFFDPKNIEINGITTEMVKTAPTFADIFPKLRQMLENKTVIAHNAVFDMGVMRSCIWQYHLPKIKFNTCCTVQISRKVWPSLTNHKLDTLGNFFQINFSHHDALDDAKVCAKIPLAAGRVVSASDFDTLIAKIGIKKRPFKC
ncbi:3'-5' exonuclease [Pectinatus sottacetonis]|uniref:3'-5' exonuclease n=1 Tax=Pectinatus sottacetonis TaxID=1002795 RepID=UPI001E51951E|nr:3'-5' exonuclease [Pectinatus sottacetonis]